MASAHQPPSAPVLLSFPTNDALVDALAAFVAKASKDSIDKKGKFTVAISGGSLPKLLGGLINNPTVKWNKWYARSFAVLLAFTDARKGTFTMSMNA